MSKELVTQGPDDLTVIDKYMNDDILMQRLQEVSHDMQIATESTVSDISNGLQILMVRSKIRHTLESLFNNDLVSFISKTNQNTSTGFKTDRKDGYDNATVKMCIISAIETGLFPFNNEFNIIKGNFYITKNGFAGKMARDSRFGIVDLQYAGISHDKSASTVCIKMHCKWVYNGKPYDKIFEFTLGSDTYTKLDAYIGKSERKAYNKIWTMMTGLTIAEGDVDDSVSVVGTGLQSVPDKNPTISVVSK